MAHRIFDRLPRMPFALGLTFNKALRSGNEHRYEREKVAFADLGLMVGEPLK
jgi:hypothetical protein